MNIKFERDEQNICDNTQYTRVNLILLHIFAVVNFNCMFGIDSFLGDYDGLLNDKLYSGDCDGLLNDKLYSGDVKRTNRTQSNITQNAVVQSIERNQTQNSNRTQSNITQKLAVRLRFDCVQQLNRKYLIAFD